GGFQIKLYSISLIVNGKLNSTSVVLYRLLPKQVKYIQHPWGPQFKIQPESSLGNSPPLYPLS
ncbi:hypothetical protein BCR42DRAFT_405037, partial [Absidia repens]